MRRPEFFCAHRRRDDRESGQAMVEFLLVLFPLIVFVGGVIQLGIGIANWHDLNRIANEGARYAAINAWPNCTSANQPCTGNPACNAVPAALVGRSLSNYLRCEAVDAGIPTGVTVTICHPGTTAAPGDPITVKLDYPMNFLSLDGNAEKVRWLGLDLHGEATMRLESTPSVAPGACP